MLTVYQTLKRLDPEGQKRLISRYINRFVPIDSFETHTIQDARVKLMEFYQWLLSLAPEDNKDDYIYYLCHSHDRLNPYVNLQPAKELGPKFENYGAEFSPAATTLGYYIADTKLTQYNLFDLLAAIMHDISWTGYRQEKLKDYQDNLNEIAIDDDDFDDEDQDIEKITKPLDFDISDEYDKYDKHEHELQQKIFQLKGELISYSQQQEADKIAKLLKSK